MEAFAVLEQAARSGTLAAGARVFVDGATSSPVPGAGAGFLHHVQLSGSWACLPPGVPSSCPACHRHCTARPPGRPLPRPLSPDGGQPAGSQTHTSHLQPRGLRRDKGHPSLPSTSLPGTFRRRGLRSAAASDPDHRLARPRDSLRAAAWGRGVSSLPAAASFPNSTQGSALRVAFAGNGGPVGAPSSPCRRHTDVPSSPHAGLCTSVCPPEGPRPVRVTLRRLGSRVGHLGAGRNGHGGSKCPSPAPSPRASAWLLLVLNALFWESSLFWLLWHILH